MPLQELFRPGTGAPIIVAPGWGTQMEGHYDFIDTLARTGRPVLYVESLRRGHTAVQHRSPQRYPRIAVLQAAHIRQTMRAHGLAEGAIGIGLSYGGLNMLVAAHSMPSAFKRVITLGGAALCADTPVRLAWRLLTTKRRHDKWLAEHHPDELVRRLSRAGFGHAVKYVAANPQRAIAEGWMLGGYSALPLVHELEHRGVEVYLLHGTDDVLFTEAMMEAITSVQPGRQLVMPNIAHDAQWFPAATVKFLQDHHLLD